MIARLLSLRVDLRDEAAAAEVTPEALAAYCERTGWRLATTTTVFRVYHRDDAPRAEVQAPLEAGWPHYGRRICQEIGILAGVEGRSPLAVWVDLVGLTPSEADCRAAEGPRTRPAPERLPSAPPEAGQGVLPGLEAPGPGRPSAVHRWGIIAAEDMPALPLDPGGRKALVQSCPHCGWMRRRANTGARLGAEDTYSHDGVEWQKGRPPCRVKR